MKAPSALLLAVALAVPSLHAPLAAQDSARVEVGARVRIMTTGSHDWNATGNVMRLTNDTIEVTAGRVDAQFLPAIDRAQAFPPFRRADISRLDVSIRQQRHTLEGLGYGVLIGGGAGALLGFASGGLKCDHYPGASDCTDVPAAAFAAIAGIGLGIVGGAVGLVVGSLTTTDVWAPLSKDAIVAPITGDRGRVGLSIRF